MTSFAKEVIQAAKAGSNASLLSQAGSDSLLQLVDKLDGCGEAEIFKDFQAVVEAGIAVDYLHAILLASPSASVRGKRRRLLCFAKGIKLLKDCTLSTVYAKELLGILLSDVRHLTKEDAKRCCDQITDSLTITTNAESQGVGHILELLPQVTARAGIETQQTMVLKLCTIVWPPTSAVLIATTLVEMATSDDEVARTIAKLEEMIEWNGDSDAGAAVLEPITAVLDPTEIPGLVYQMFVLARKHSQYKLQILNLVLSRCDRVHRKAIALAGGERLSDRDQSIFSTVVHHISFAMSQDQELCKAALAMIKQRQLFVPSEIPGGEYSASATMFSPWRVLVPLLAVRMGRFEEKIIGGMIDAIVEVHSAAHLLDGALWYDSDCAIVVCDAGPNEVARVFSDLIRHGFAVNQIAPALVKLAVGLMDKWPVRGNAAGAPAASGPSHGSVYIQKILQVEKESHAVTDGLEAAACLGATMLVELFEAVDFARSQIVRECSFRIGISSSSFPLYVYVLDQLITRFSQYMGEFESELYEGLASLANLDYFGALRLIKAVVPLLKLSGAVADRCLMMVRKCSYSRDVTCRRSAVGAMMTILDAVLADSSERNADLNALSQNSFQAQSIDLAGVKMSIDEVLALLRRCLTHQLSVRICVYQGLVKICQQYPVIRPAAAKLLVGHLQSFLHEPGSANAGILNIHACIDHSTNLPVDCFKTLLCAILQCALGREAFFAPPPTHDQDQDDVPFAHSYVEYQDELHPECEAAVNAVIEFMSSFAQNSLAKFGIEKTMIFTAGSEDGRRNIGLGHAALDVLEACMLCTASSALANMRTGQETAAWDTIVESISAHRNALRDHLGNHQLSSGSSKDVAGDKATQSEAGDDQPKKRGSKTTSKPGVEANVSNDTLIWGQLAFGIQRLTKANAELENENEDEEELPDEDVGLQTLALRSVVSGLEHAIVTTSEALHAANSGSVLLTASTMLAEQLYESDCIKTLCPLLLKDFSRHFNANRDSAKSGGKGDKGKGGSQTSCTEWALYGLVECVRAQALLAKHRGESVADALIDLLHTAFKALRSNVRKDDRGGQEPAMSMTKLIRHFLKLLNQLISENDMNEALIVIRLLRLLVDTLSSDQAETVAEQLLAYAGEEVLGAVPTGVAQAFLQLILYESAHTPLQRLKRCKAIAGAIVVANKTELGSSQPDPDGQKLTLIHAKTFQMASSILLQVLEKTYTESEQVIRVLNRTALRSAGPLSAGSVDHSQPTAAESVESESRPRPNSTVAESHMSDAIRAAMIVVSDLMEGQILGAAAERMIALGARLYKMLSRLTKWQVARKARWVSEGYRKLVEAAARIVSPKVYDYLPIIHNHQETLTAKKISRQAKIVPELIFQMEQADVQLIKLGKLVRDKQSITRWVRRATARDFKLAANKIAEAQQQEAEKATRGKRQAGGQKGQSRKKAKKDEDNNSAAGDDDDDDDGEEGGAQNQENDPLFGNAQLGQPAPQARRVPPPRPQLPVKTEHEDEESEAEEEEEEVEDEQEEEEEYDARRVRGGMFDDEAAEANDDEEDDEDEEDETRRVHHASSASKRRRIVQEEEEESEEEEW